MRIVIIINVDFFARQSIINCKMDPVCECCSDDRSRNGALSEESIEVTLYICKTETPQGK